MAKRKEDSADRGSVARLPGWLSLSRTLEKSGFILRGEAGVEATLTLTQLAPLTLELDIPGLGKVDVAIERRSNSTAQFHFRAPRQVKIRRRELDDPAQGEEHGATSCRTLPYRKAQ